jgi:hypothetical protein
MGALYFSQVPETRISSRPGNNRRASGLPIDHRKAFLKKRENRPYGLPFSVHFDHIVAKIQSDPISIIQKLDLNVNLIEILKKENDSSM